MLEEWGQRKNERGKIWRKYQGAERLYSDRRGAI